jgi:hypothetical protein
MNCELKCILPSNFDSYEKNIQESIINYLNQLDNIEKKAYIIGKQHLGTSFNIIKSNGYINWKKNNS